VTHWKAGLSHVPELKVLAAGTDVVPSSLGFVSLVSDGVSAHDQYRKTRNS
jgi:hypothetical protein